MDVFKAEKLLSQTMRGLNGRLECLNPQATVKICGQVAPLHGRKTSFGFTLHFVEHTRITGFKFHSAHTIL
jgi:hypothetical protein